MTAEVILKILKDLTEGEFKEFIWYLKDRDSMKPYQAIKAAKLENANRPDTVDLMLKTFDLHGALEVTNKVLQKIPRNDLLQLLQPSSSSSSSGSEGQSHFSQIRENLSPEKSINLFHCLNELNDGSLVEEIQQSLSSGRLSTDELSPALCSALIFISLSSGKHLDVLDQKNLSLERAAKASNKALLSDCNLSERSCGALTSVLSSPSSSLRELDLSHNDHIRIRNHLLPMVEPAGDQWLKPGLRKYARELTIDTNTVNRELKLSDNNRKVTHVREEDQPYPDHPDRFEYYAQLLCRTGLTGRCYWEVEWRGRVYISVSYRGITRKGGSDNCWFGGNDQSWSLECSDDDDYSVLHNNTKTPITSSSCSSSGRAAVYVDWPAGSLSFYRVSSDTLIHIYTFRTTFTEPLYPGFGFSDRSHSSVSLCSVEERESPPL